MNVFLSGNEAIARGVYEASCKIATAYPGTPSSEILENISKYNNIYSEWCTNEKVALEVAIGSAIAGKRTVVAMKQVGMNVAADPLFTSAYTGINAGLVIVTADEPGVHSSQNEQDNRNYARFAKLPMLEPSDSQEAKDFVIKAFEISEEFDTPVILRITTRICHTQCIVKLNEPMIIDVKEYEKDSVKRCMIPTYALKRHIALEKKIMDIEEYSNETNINCVEEHSKDYGIITSGITYQYVKEALPEASILKIGLSYPLPEKMIINFVNKYKKVYVVEENDPYLETEIKALGLNIIAKDNMLRVGELSIEILKEWIDNTKTETNKPVDNLPVRLPQFCPGCPHRSTFHILKKRGFRVCGDIGCYGLGVLPPFSAMDTIICMGASVGMAHGFDLTIDDGRTIGVIGDSTMLHSGITNIINMIHNNSTSKIIVLDNEITAMTGHQPNPSSTFNIRNEVSRKFDFEKVFKAMGVTDVCTISAFKYKELEDKIREKNTSLQIIVVTGACALRVPKSKPYHITDKCIQCKACLKIGCPAINLNEDGKVEILEYYCAGCSICSQICPKQAIEEVK